MRTLTFLVAVGIAVPSVAGQAVPRTSGTSGTATSSGSSSGGGGSSSSSGSSGSSSSSSGSSGPVGASGSSMFGGEFRSTPSRVASGNSSRTGTAAVRTAPAPGGVAGGGEATSSSSSSSRFGSELSQGFGGNASNARSRDGRPITGSAAVRPIGQGGGGGGELVSFPFYGPWGLYYPWYSGWGWNTGFMYYNPWSYGATRWYWGPYGMWYDPYSYWDPFWSSGSYSSYSARDREPRVVKTTGSLRIKANPGSAKVYIDNALVGTVEEFDGLNDGLEVEGGRHTLEIRAEGFVTKTQEINVKVGTKQTVRINLKEKK
ncbi:MAG TPA: PEGA domain-containing protein [Vicinamibacterales bacterium]|nr:PEGA domain-containing protein [Vicinamibacterales bacterium]